MKKMHDLCLSGSQINLQERPSPRIKHSSSRITRSSSAVPAPGYHGPSELKANLDRPQSADESLVSRASEYGSKYSIRKSLFDSQQLASSLDLTPTSLSPPLSPPIKPSLSPPPISPTRSELKPGLFSKPPPIPSTHSTSDLEEDIVDLKFRNWFPNSSKTELKFSNNTEVPAYIPDSRISTNDIPSSCRTSRQNECFKHQQRYAISDNYLNKIGGLTDAKILYKDRTDRARQRNATVQNTRNMNKQKSENTTNKSYNVLNIHDTSTERENTILNRHTISSDLQNTPSNNSDIQSNFCDDNAVSNLCHTLSDEQNIFSDKIESNLHGTISDEENTSLDTHRLSSNIQTKSSSQNRHSTTHSTNSNLFHSEHPTFRNKYLNSHDTLIKQYDDFSNLNDRLTNEQKTFSYETGSSNDKNIKNATSLEFNFNESNEHVYPYSCMDNIETLIGIVEKEEGRFEGNSSIYRKNTQIVENTLTNDDKQLTNTEDVLHIVNEYERKSTENYPYLNENSMKYILNDSQSIEDRKKNRNCQNEINKHEKEGKDNVIIEEHSTELSDIDELGAVCKDFYVKYKNIHADEQNYDTHCRNEEQKIRFQNLFQNETSKCGSNYLYCSNTINCESNTNQCSKSQNKTQNSNNISRFQNNYTISKNESNSQSGNHSKYDYIERKKCDSCYRKSSMERINKNATVSQTFEENLQKEESDFDHENNQCIKETQNSKKGSLRRNDNDNHYSRSMNILNKMYKSKTTITPSSRSLSNWEKEFLKSNENKSESHKTDWQETNDSPNQMEYGEIIERKSSQNFKLLPEEFTRNEKIQKFQENGRISQEQKETNDKNVNTRNHNHPNEQIKEHGISVTREFKEAKFYSHTDVLEMYDFEQDEKILNHILEQSKYDESKSILKNAAQTLHDYGEDYPVKDLNSSTYNEIVDILKVLEKEENRNFDKGDGADQMNWKQTENKNSKHCETIQNTRVTFERDINSKNEVADKHVVTQNCDVRFADNCKITEEGVKTVQIEDIYNFLDKVNKDETSVDIIDSTKHTKLNGQSKLAELMKLNSADLAQKYLTLSILTDEKQIIISTLEKKIEQLDKHYKDIKTDTDATVKRLQKFIEQLIKEKKSLSDQCSSMCKDMEKKYTQVIETMEERHKIEIKKNSEKHLVAEKIRREKWIDNKTQKIKELTVKGLEPELIKMTNAHQEEIAELRKAHNRQIEENDAIWHRKVNSMKEKFEEDLQNAILAEKENNRKRLNEEMKTMENNYQQQRQHLLNEIQIERENLDKQAENIRNEKEKELNQKLEKINNQRKEMCEQLEKRHQRDIEVLKEELKKEKELWIQNKTAQMEEREQLIREQSKRERDKHIELIIEKLEKEQNERDVAADNKIKQMKETHEKDISEMEQSMNTVKTKLTETRNALQTSEDLVNELKAQVHSLQIDNKNNATLLDKYRMDNEQLKLKYEENTNDQIDRLKEELQQTRQYFETLISRMKKDQERELSQVYARVKETIQNKEETISLLMKQKQAALTQCASLENIIEQKNKQR